MIINYLILLVKHCFMQSNFTSKANASSLSIVPVINKVVSSSNSSCGPMIF